MFAILEAICFLLVVQGRGYQSTSLLNSTNLISTSLYTALANSKEYFSLKEENEKLAKENTFLYNKIKSAYEAIPTKKLIVSDTLYRQKYIFLSAKVINNSVNRRDNYLTINIGKNQGAIKDMGFLIMRVLLVL